MKSEILAEWEYDREEPPNVLESTKDAAVKIELLEEKTGGQFIVFRNEGDDGSWALAYKSPYDYG